MRSGNTGAMQYQNKQSDREFDGLSNGIFAFKKVTQKTVVVNKIPSPNFAVQGYR